VIRLHCVTCNIFSLIPAWHHSHTNLLLRTELRSFNKYIRGKVEALRMPHTILVGKLERETALRRTRDS
jgi:hypothetical protein